MRSAPYGSFSPRNSPSPRKRAPSFCRVVYACASGTSKRCSGLRERLLRHAAQRTDVVEDVRRAAVRADDEIVIARMDGQAHHRHGREAVLPLHPRLAAVELIQRPNSVPRKSRSGSTGSCSIESA